MPPATNVRLDVARWVVAHLRLALPQAQVESGWPGDSLTRETVWVDEIEGDQTLPVMVAGRRQRDDRFTVPLEVRAVGGDLDTTADLLSALIAGVEDVLAEAHTLDDDIPGILSAEVARENSIVARTPEGPRGFARIELAVHARLA